MNTGWQCPACRRCFAPHVNECSSCAAQAAPSLPSYPFYPGTAPVYPTLPSPPFYPGGWGAGCGATTLDCIGRNDGIGKVSFEAETAAYIANVRDISAQLSAGFASSVTSTQ